MGNIDKDIHMLKSYAGMTHKLTDNQGRPKLDQAIENVLKEVERLQRENNTLTTQNAMMSERHFKDSGKLKELDTYKKVAEKLAEELDKITEEIAREKGIHYVCKFCNSCSDIECQQCILDWARKEVDKQ